MKARQKLEKKQLAVMAVAVVVLLLLVWFYIVPSTGNVGNDSFKGIVLDTGDIYFGRISYFPRFTLYDAYTIQSVPDSENPSGFSYQVVPLSSSVWGPDKIYINRDKIVFIGDVGQDSQVMQYINRKNTQ